MPTFLTRRITFAAAHRYRVAEWSDEKNAATFGLCARPNYHGHTYACDVTVTGDVDPITGFVADLAILDRALQREVRDRLDHANLNLDLPEFADGKLMPTGENLARFIAERVQGALGGAARVTRVIVAEDSTLSATYEPG
ncbi:MAG: 6-carboxytetrahydropterin synthase [Gemmatimonadota bacterium]|nr:6-carboxytetrahydropterin synthase [Gemmatimonadota bacterium]